VWPVVWRVPDWIPVFGAEAITSFGVSVLAGALLAGWLFTARLARVADVTPSRSWDLVVVALVAGLIGARLYFLLLHGGAVAGLAGRSGFVWYGGLAAGGLALLWRGAAAGVPPARLADAAVPALALGYAVGRIGCFLAGADYGLPTAWPVGVAFPAGAPPTTATNLLAAFAVTGAAGAVNAEGFVRVHPTQLYEAAFALLLAAWLLRAERRQPLPDAMLAGWWLVAAGAARFAVEFVRLKDDRLLGPLTVAQLLSAGLAAGGVLVLAGARRRAAPVREETAPC
jgi:phosphatidylglycerol---prolipoprotein diacylglyceryl transferase